MKFLLAACLFAAAPAALCAENTLSVDAMHDWKIVCSAGAIPAEKYAAQEFQTLFLGLTHARLPIVSEGSGAGSIYIGPDAVVASGLAPVHEAFGEEVLRIIVGKEALCIDGGRPRGTLYGVYEFFEELCGVRFLTQDHTYYPEQALIPLGAAVIVLVLFTVSGLLWRHAYTGSAWRKPRNSRSDQKH